MADLFSKLDTLKSRVIDLLVKNRLRERDVEGMFIKWYFNCNKKDYYPVDFNISDDLKYYHDVKGYRINIEDLQRKVNKIVEEVRDMKAEKKEEKEAKSFFSSKQLKMLSDRYEGEKDKKEATISFLSRLYSFLGGTNNHLSVPPSLIGEGWVEMFGSPINTKGKYCSPFEIEKDFGSLGSFFDYFVIPGFHLVNPPYDVSIIEKAVSKLIKELDGVDDTTPLSFLVVLPNWGDMNCIKVMKESKYLKKHTLLKRDKCRFYDYYNDKFFSVGDILLFYLTADKNDDFDFNDFTRRWSNI
jgi:hypothetical protein